MKQGRPGGGLWQAVLAVLVGNAVYFAVLYSRLPEEWRHQPFVFDQGLVVDLGLCVALYGLFRLAAVGLTRSDRGR